MPKKDEKAAVSVKLACTYSGHPANPGPGEVIAVDAEEAARLIAIGAATAADPQA